MGTPRAPLGLDTTCLYVFASYCRLVLWIFFFFYLKYCIFWIYFYFSLNFSSFCLS
ncbi:hypothetical protein C2G38_2121295 [Gigaspora rosea]|uniref:Uncharacterized protein n=1 Tax=Gigaspora rosea TaxID=44941 RepID=A0A397U1R4_9GLOM|nr:hypothetical protein C2G38_2121295 [Gigaspora rosea]